MNLTNLSNEELLVGLGAIVGESCRLLAQLLAYLGEVEVRGIYREQACSSMYKFCIERLGMSENEAYARIVAARAARAFPSILEGIASGELTLTNVVLLAPHLTVSNHEELLKGAFRKTKREVEKSLSSKLSPMERYKMQIVVSHEVRDLIERARDLMRHRNPSGDLEIVIGEAMKLLIQKLEKEQVRGSNGVSAATRKSVFARDGGQCTFVDEHGNRCTERGFLQVEHTHARGRGGTDDLTNLCLLCQAHNLLMAERTYGREHVQKKIHLAQQRRVERAATSPPAG